MRCSTAAEGEATKEERRRIAVSVQFGRWNIDGLPVDRDYLAKAGEMLAPYGPDGGGAYIKDNVGILYRAFHTTKESRRETQPCVIPSGAVLTWDGRLDNREELVRDLRGVLTIGATDLAIVSAAYEAWGTKCFAKLIGDWALSVWDPISRSLILAKDLIGTRHLYYSSDEKQITWSTILDPLVLLAGKTFTLEEEYIAGWLAFFPATHLTPYVGIHSVPPSSFVRLAPGRQSVSKYWDFDPSKRIRYRTDAEYEEHFRYVFGEAVRRRLRSDSPVLAELSGGMDSSSIVCMADTIIARGAAETPRLDTISYYDDSEPNWNERPYFTKIEEKRGRIGCHIDVGNRKSFQIDFNNDRFVATPGTGGRPNEPSRQFTSYVVWQGNRVLLSGLGGDEVAGGIPTPVPELQDLLTRGPLWMLARHLKVWALNKRKPWFLLLFEAVRGFFPLSLVGVSRDKQPAPWLTQRFVGRNRTALHGYERRLKFFGALPNFQGNLFTLEVLRRQLAASSLPSAPSHEKRFPYLDRDLLEFTYAVPRGQLVRAGQRRSLMRRALVAVVPKEILTRKRKAYVVRAALVAISTEWSNLGEMTHCMLGASLGIVNPCQLRDAVQKAQKGQLTAVVQLMRTLGIEHWLRNLEQWNAAGAGTSRTFAVGFRQPAQQEPVVPPTQKIEVGFHAAAEKISAEKN
jgi:asparagine synthase (glutamine-hydrolysing)